MSSVMFYKSKSNVYILQVLHVKSEIVSNTISNRMLNGKMPRIAGKK